MIYFITLCRLSFTAERNWNTLLYIILNHVCVCFISCFRITIGLYFVRLVFLIAFLSHGFEQWFVISVEHNK
jgi:hypothetical protein